ncbi:Uncharacterized conserved protein [Streptococcus dysgalactiae subsp. equisimilis]|nr:Uncharacterized conserved protein [Streptococcus dysgalactiae subsp. equisimilis]
MSISKRAQQFQDILRQRGLDLTVQELPDSTRTADDAAQALGCEKAQIVKSLVFRTRANTPVLVLASGPNRVNEKAISRLLGDKISKADADFVKEVTGLRHRRRPAARSQAGGEAVRRRGPADLRRDLGRCRHAERGVQDPGCLTEILPAHQVISVK